MDNALLSEGAGINWQVPSWPCQRCGGEADGLLVLAFSTSFFDIGQVTHLKLPLTRKLK